MENVGDARHTNVQPVHLNELDENFLLDQIDRAEGGPSDATIDIYEVFWTFLILHDVGGSSTINKGSKGTVKGTWLSWEHRGFKPGCASVALVWCLAKQDHYQLPTFKKEPFKNKNLFTDKTMELERLMEWPTEIGGDR
jgi:hypothetical protein